MTRLLLAFDDPDALTAAARHLRGLGIRDLDAHVPYRLDGLDAALDLPEPRVRPVMLVAAVLAAAAFWALQWWTATQAYPINSGGRPLNSWQVFVFAVFEMGVLAAAGAGLAAMLWACRLPTLHQPFFTDTRTETASDDGFFLSVPRGPATPDRLALSELTGLRAIIEVQG